jgi:hypothetical protein
VGVDDGPDNRQAKSSTTMRSRASMICAGERLEGDG